MLLDHLIVSRFAMNLVCGLLLVCSRPIEGAVFLVAGWDDAAADGLSVTTGHVCTGQRNDEAVSSLCHQTPRG